MKLIEVNAVSYFENTEGFSKLPSGANVIDYLLQKLMTPSTVKRAFFILVGTVPCKMEKKEYQI